MPLHRQGTWTVTPFESVSEQPPPSPGLQKLSLTQTQKLATRLGEQKPPGPQSASTRQLLAVAQVLAAESVAADRHAHGALLGQSESPEHSSYEQWRLHARPMPVRQRPFVPAVHVLSPAQAAGRGVFAPQTAVLPAPRSDGQLAPSTR